MSMVFALMMATGSGWTGPENSKPDELSIQEPVLVEQHHAPGMYTEWRTPGPHCWAGRSGGLRRFHHAKVACTLHADETLQHVAPHQAQWCLAITKDFFGSEGWPLAPALQVCEHKHQHLIAGNERQNNRPQTEKELEKDLCLRV